MQYMGIKKKFLLKIISLLVLCMIIGTVLFFRIFPSFGIDIEKNYKQINYLNISPDIYLRQTVNNCAPYAVMAAINILKGKIVDPEELAEETDWRMIKNLTFPQGLINLLHKYEIKTKEYGLRFYKSDEKINWLKNQIDNRFPVILLVKVKHIQHYFTIVGYDAGGFMIYDSLQEKISPESRQTQTDNKDYAGNRYYKQDELISLWNDGGYLLGFRNWAVVCY